eukprot:TRINITY_DN2254_c0_g1_i1.p1 TRINITY_DN2254_c0_g1~~TRINITY_DN2254_c0_g1_i1.p1  ORF type:complete len:407 (+),score=94.28 TRINITY_DN2254_c0_g1_i1:55-1275(+)
MQRPASDDRPAEAGQTPEAPPAKRDGPLSKRDVTTPSHSAKDAEKSVPPVGEEKPQSSRRELVWALGVFSFSAVGMTTGNKLAVEYLRDKSTGTALPATLVLLQMIGTLVLLGLNYSKIDPSLVSLHHARKWLPIFVLSASAMYTSARSFVYVNVSFVIIMRNVGTFLTTAVEYFVRKQQVSTETLLAEATILAGIVMYGHGMIHFKEFWPGFFWCTANTVLITGWSVLLKYKMDNDPDISALNKFAMSFYNNLMGVPYFLGAAIATNEHKLWSSVFTKVSIAGWVVILCTCGIGYMISTSGFALTRLVSATTYNVVNNLVKVVNILFGLIILRDSFPGAMSVAGCFVALGAGAWYSAQATIEKQRESIEPCSPMKVIPLALAIAGATAALLYGNSRTDPVAAFAP